MLEPRPLTPVDPAAPVVVTPGPNDDLPALPAWNSRSFWVMAVAAALSLSALFKVDLLGFFGVEDSAALTEKVITIAAFVGPVAVWLLRRAPNYRLTGGEKTPVVTK